MQKSDKKFFYANVTDQQIEFETDNNSYILSVWHICLAG